MGTPGATELLIVLAIVLLILGPKRLPGLGRQLGGGLREFKEAITGSGRSDRADDEGGTRAVGDPSVSEARRDQARGQSSSDGPDDGDALDGQVVPERRRA